MPERTEQLLVYPNTGLFLMGPKRAAPLTALRRAVGLHDTNVGSLRSRKGETQVSSIAGAHTLGRLDTVRFQAAAGVLYREGVALITGLTGDYLALTKSPPAPGLVDSLFVTGGGASRKIDASGTVQNWGIAPPADGLIAAIGGGSTPLEGRYWYHTTFMNTTTGNRSNPEETLAEVLAISGTEIALSAIPLSSDSQVDRREIWRTVGDGGAFFLCADVNDNTTTTFTDTVHDQLGIGESIGTSVLEATELPLDNSFPDQTYSDAIIDGLVAFWISREDGKKGRLYYSPLGRPEGVKGYVTVTNDNDALQRVIVWNGRYVFTLKGVYKIDGNDPYSRRLITGVPGVPAVNKRTVLASPYGIFYQAADGLRLFDGSRSELVAFERIGSLFRGETLDYFPPFEGLYADFARNQYFISNGTRTLALNYVTGFIRELGQGFTSLFFEEDTKYLLGAASDGVYVIESESASAFETFDVETGSLQLPVSKNAVVKRLRVKGQFQGQTMQVSLLIDEVETALPPLTVQTDTVEYAINLPARSLAVRVQGTLTLPIILEQIEVDIYEPRDDAIAATYKYRDLT